MNIQRLLNSPMGRIIISILLGLGFATLFRKVCADGSCLQFDGPVISEVDGQTYEFGEYCYKYELQPRVCDNKRKTVEMRESESESKSESSSWIPFSQNK
uniref:Uncharacterized protein n=1 Tax=viral metagenome TaxID=1070528 RepID=A0A6C0CL79_9ZZZZ